MLSFSTSWNSHRHTDGEMMINEIRSLGFEGIGLSRGLAISYLPGIRRQVNRGMVKTIYLEDKIPAPLKVDRLRPADCELVAPHPEARHRAVESTRQTIRYAAELGARHVVVQLGRATRRSLNPRLLGMAAEGKLHSPAYVRHKLAGIRRRERLSDRLISLAQSSLDQILPEAEKAAVVVAIESGKDLDAFPSERELLRLFELYPHHANLGYWHDFGQVQIKENLGFLDHAQWLILMRERLAGAQLRDVQWPGPNDRVPFTGSVNFERLMPLLPKQAPLVWKLSAKCKSGDIRNALPVWRNLYGDWSTVASN